MRGTCWKLHVPDIRSGLASSAVKSTSLKMILSQCLLAPVFVPHFDCALNTHCQLACSLRILVQDHLCNTRDSGREQSQSLHLSSKYSVRSAS